MSFSQFVGLPCFQHPNYIFYKAFKYKSHNRNRILTSGDFFFLKILKEIPVCIGEIELLWKDVASNLFLASLKLYFLPENTPEGRQDDTGEDEVIALGERLVVKLDDLVPLIQHDIQWQYGSPTYCSKSDKLGDKGLFDDCERTTQDSSNITKSEDIKAVDVLKGENGKKFHIGCDVIKMDGHADYVCEKSSRGAANLVVLNYPKYCRYRAMQKRLEGCENDWILLAVVVAIGGFSSPTPGCRVVFCRDTFYESVYDELNIRMDHMLPVLKGRSKGKKSKQAAQKDSQQDSDSMDEAFANVTPSISTSSRPRRSTESSEINEDKVSTEEQAFLIGLHKFMHDAKMPIGRIPSLGFKQIDLYYFYKQAEKLGGYDAITHKRMWKHLYDKLGGNSSNTSAATCTRKHYERLLLPYERHLRKIKVGKTKRKHTKRLETGIEKKLQINNESKRTVTVTKEGAADMKPSKSEATEDVPEPENKENVRHNQNEDTQIGVDEAFKHKDIVIPVKLEHSKSTEQRDSEVLEIPIVKQPACDSNALPVIEIQSVDSSNNKQHFSLVQKEKVHQQELIKSSTVTSLTNNIFTGDTTPALPYTGVVYRGSYLLPPQMLQAPWTVMNPIVATSTPNNTEVLSPHLGGHVHDTSIMISLPPMPSSSKTNQNSVPFTVSSQDIRSKSSSGKISVSSHKLAPPTAGSKTLKATHANNTTQYKTLFPVNDNIHPAHQSSQPSQHFSSKDFLGCSSQNLVSLLHPTPPGHRNQAHLPPAPVTIYLHPTSNNQFSLLQSSVTFPPPIAHSYPRKRAYPFDSSTVPSTGLFPSPDMVLDRIRNSTGLPRSSIALNNRPRIPQQYEDPRNIFRQTHQTVSTSQNVCSSQSKEPVPQIEKPPSTKTKNSGRRLQRPYTAYGNMSSQEFQQVLLREECAVPSNNNKDHIKSASTINGLLSAQHSSKLVLPVSHASPVPSSSKDVRLASALFGTQFTALPRNAKPSEMPSPQSPLLDPSSAAAVAMSLNSHLHPAFMSSFLQAGTTTPTLNPQLQMLTNSYAMPASAQFSAYEEMLRQNGFSTFLTTSAQKKGSNKN